jgi:N-acetylneuraminate lyase
MSKYALSDIKGVLPALVTCFDQAGEFDEGRQRALVRWLLGKGVDGFYLTGSTGESFMMTPAERERVVEVVMDEVAGKVPVIVHVGAISTKLSIQLARQAEKAGADAISSVPPIYWKYSNDDVYGYYKDICGSVSIPMVIYNVPLAGLVGYDLIKRLSGIEGVGGIKYTASTHYEIMRLKEELGKDYVIFSGADEMAMSGLSFGADGIIGSFYNMIPELFLKLYAAVRAGDLPAAAEFQRQANAVIFYCLDHNYFSVMKRSLGWVGVDSGWCRKPIANLDDASLAEVKAALGRIRDENGIAGVSVLDAI